MEKTKQSSLAEKLSIGKEKLLSQVDAATLIIVLTIGLSLLDFYSHPHMGQADLERRALLIKLLGPIAKHIGNYGLSAIPAMSAVLLKNFVEFSTVNPKIKEINRRFFQTFIASLFAINGLIEVFPGNNELIPDLVAGFIGVISGLTSGHIIVHKMNKAKAKNDIIEQ